MVAGLAVRHVAEVPPGDTNFRGLSQTLLRLESLVEVVRGCYREGISGSAPIPTLRTGTSVLVQDVQHDRLPYLGSFPVSLSPPSQAQSRLENRSQLVPVAEAAEQVLGHRVTNRTALRWAIAGRAGVKLPTVRGIRGTRCTTVEQFREWLAASSGNPSPASAPDLRDPAADAGLAALGIGGARR